MGGEIRVVSQLGKGSTFAADLVLTPASPVDDSGPAIASTGARVLLAFDRPLERRALREALCSAGASAVECEFALAGSTLESAAKEGLPFDRLIVDGAVGPAASGELLCQARAVNQLGRVRCVVLVNVLERAGLSDYRAAGFDAYLVRPVRPASLLLQLGLRSSRGVPQPAFTGAAESRPQTTSAANSRRRVLLAEDNEINSLLAKRVLEKCGCDYIAVNNGAAAVAAVRLILEGQSPSVDLILMDIFMPQLDGVEAARAIKQLFAGSNRADSAPPIVALTANAFAEDRQRYLEAGMDDYLAKPFDRASLETVLVRWFGQRSDGDAGAAA
jgi:CheY-like chemotaxis protein